MQKSFVGSIKDFRNWLSQEKIKEESKKAARGSIDYEIERKKELRASLTHKRYEPEDVATENLSIESDKYELLTVFRRLESLIGREAAKDYFFKEVLCQK